MRHVVTTVRSLIFSLLLSFLVLVPNQAADLIDPVYLTFEKEDTSNSITINFITDEQSQSSFAYIGSKAGDPDNPRDYTKKVRSRTSFIDGVDKTYHHVLVEGLSANTTYYFRVGDEKIGYSKEYKFQTLPSAADQESEVRLMVGGDMSVNEKIVETAQSALKENPHAIIVGGDIAYANGKVENESKWMDWFKKMERIMITADGRLIPLILAIGNHETSIGTAIPGNKVPFFYTLFPQAGEKAYFKRRLGANSGLVILDTGHHTLHRAQKGFLEDALKSYKDLPHRLAAYHAPLYPNHRGYSGLWARRGRRHWGKLFDEYKLTVGFEHHDHTLKRTHVIRDKKVSPFGTVYVGDGCWGKNAREIKEKWYLKKSTGDTHVWFARVTKDRVELKAMGKDNGVFDHFLIRNFPGLTKITELL